jgi:type I restriction enzyme S subunit
MEMGSRWPKIRLGEVLQRSEETVEPQADTEYREITVRLWANGVVERGRVLGASLSGRRFIAHAGQFIASRIDARNGAMGLVPQSLDGALVTNDFPLFALNAERLEPKFLGWLCRTTNFVELCLRASEGTTNRVRLKEDRFLALEIVLPPLAEQRRLVAKIEELAAQIHEARTLRHEAAEQAEALLVSMAHRADLDADVKRAMGWKMKRLNDVIYFVDDSHKVTPNRSFPNLGIYSFGRGLFHKPAIDGLATSAKSLRRVKTGQFIYSRLFAFEGAYGMVTPEFDGSFVSQEYPTFDCDPKFVRAEFLAAYFKPRHVWATVAEGARG